jgi:5-methyltetrahydrofolate--homocysteine methyltransferase
MIIIGEKINGSIPSMAKAIVARDEDYIRALAGKQADAGAAYIDVCASTAADVELETLKWLIGLAQDATETPIAIDSPSARVCAEAIRFCNKPGMVNSVSMEGDKVEQVFPVIAGTPWKCVALLSDDTGIPKTTEKRLEVFDALMEKAVHYGIAADRFYIDPLVEMLCTSEDGIAKLTATMKRIKEVKYRR